MVNEGKYPKEVNVHFNLFSVLQEPICFFIIGALIALSEWKELLVITKMAKFTAIILDMVPFAVKRLAASYGVLVIDPWGSLQEHEIVV